jgi:hypothetical protein
MSSRSMTRYYLFFLLGLVSGSCQPKQAPTPTSSPETASFKKLYAEFLDEAQALINLLRRGSSIDLLRDQGNQCDLALARFTHMRPAPACDQLISMGTHLELLLDIKITYFKNDWQDKETYDMADEAQAMTRCREGLAKLR